MKRIIFIVLVCLIILFSDLIIGAVSKGFILKSPDVGVNQTNSVQALFHRKSDVLILGPSTANHHYDTRVIKDSLGMSVYNAGYDGQNIRYSAMVFYSYLKRCTPKLIILDVGSSVMNSSWNTNLSDMNCFYGISEPVDSIIEDLTSPIDKLKLKSNIYRYNNSWQWLLYAYSKKSQNDLDGYRPMPVNKETNFKTIYVNRTSFKVDSINLKYLNGIVNTCHDKGIKLVIGLSPSLRVAKKSELREWLYTYCKANNVQLLDYYYDERFIKHAELYYDIDHLNSEGAIIYTKDFLSKIK